LISAGGVFGAVAMLANAWHSDHSGERFWHIVTPLLASSLAFFVIGQATAPPAVMAGYLVLHSAIFAFQGLQPTHMAQNIPARDLGVGIASLNSIAQVGAFVAPILFGMTKDATDSYDLGLLLLPLSPIIAIGFLSVVRRRAARRATRSFGGLAGSI
jgi:ACS family tartrate transporter-like MFS transporter